MPAPQGMHAPANALCLQIRKRCDEPGRIVESQCRPVKDYFSECGRYSTTVPGDWSCKKDVYMEKNCPGERGGCECWHIESEQTALSMQPLRTPC